MSNINSFAENINKLVENTNNEIKVLQGMENAMVSSKDSVNVNLTDTDGSLNVFNIPSWTYMNTKLKAISSSIETILKGDGMISTGDGTGRYVKLTDVAEVPDKITDIEDPSHFNVNANWWFEDLMYPSAQITVDLRDKIDNTANRVLVDRIILKASDYEATYNSYLSNNRLDFQSLVAYLNNNKIIYTEDEEIVDLPITTAKFEGTFTVTGISYVNSVLYLTLDTLEYNVLSQTAGSVSSVSMLSVGDIISSGSFLYSVTEVNKDEKKIHVEDTLGYSVPSEGTVFNFYNEPWNNKYVNVKFGPDEIDIIYFKGINETFNLVSNEWSTPIQFISNELRLADDGSTLFSSFYSSKIADFGSRMINDIQERKISYLSGVAPQIPSVTSDDFKVVQINTQIDAALDTEDIKNLSAENETTKSTISSLKSTIASQQTDLQTLSGTEYLNLLSSINSNITELKGLETKYKTSLSQLQTLLTENDGIVYTPKYHIRGFFTIPGNSILPDGTIQHIIGFETEYRYIKEDNTGTSLDTYTYKDVSGNSHTGVYSDWNMENSNVLEKFYDETTGMYEWKNESESDGTVININQIDIPISKGEKVEFRIRSISEAGYPYNPVKSDWSAPVIMSFPANLSTSSEIENIIKDINDETTSLAIENAFETYGIKEHLNDSEANTNSVNGVYFKHRAENIAYEFSDPDKHVTSTINIQNALDAIFKFIKSFLDYSDSNVNYENLKKIIDMALSAKSISDTSTDTSV